MSPFTQHLLYIPFILALGFWLGWYFGAKGVREDWAREEKKRRREEEGR